MYPHEQIPCTLTRKNSPDNTANKTSARNSHYIIWGVWVVLIVYSLFLAPPLNANTIDYIIGSLTLNFTMIDPYIVLLLNFMALWPILYAAILLTDSSDILIPKGVFILLSFFGGIFILLPYMAIRRPRTQKYMENTVTLQIAQSKILPFICIIIFGPLFVIAMLSGNPSIFLQIWWTDRFIHVVGINFILLSILYPILIWEEMNHMHWDDPLFRIIFCALPVMGPIFYLLIRPKITLD